MNWTKVTSAIAAVAMLLVGGAAGAVTADFYTSGTCGNGTVTAGGIGSSDCYGEMLYPAKSNFNDDDTAVTFKGTGGGPPITGNFNTSTFGNGVNDANSTSAITGMFGITDWEWVAKSDDGVEAGFGLSYADGTWSIDDGVLTNRSFFVLMKQSNNFTTYLFGPMASVTGGTWQGINGGNDADDDISHMTVYRSLTVAAVPLPAAGWMLIAGLGGLAAVRRRKKA